MRRPVIPIFWAFGAGLATGLLTLGPTPVVVALLLLVAVLARRSWPGFLAVLVLAGRLMGGLVLATQAEACVERLPPTAVALRVRLREPVGRQGGMTSLLPIQAGCRGPIRARWPPGQGAAAGDIVVVAGRWRVAGRERRHGRLDVSEVREHHQGRPEPEDAIRNRLAEAIDRLYGRRAPLVDAVVLNQKADLDRNVRDQFARSGLVHLLAISGFHVGLVSGWVFALARLGRLRRSRAFAVAAFAALAYAGFLGWPPPATRAAVLSAAVCLSRVRQRVVDPGALLGFTCLLVLLIDPTAVAAPGAWLSAAAVWGITAFAWRTRRFEGLERLRLWRAVRASLGATMATAPITALVFGVVAPVGVLLNLLALPIAGVVVPGILASLVVDPLVPALAERLAAGAGLGLEVLSRLAMLGAALPLGHIEQPAGPAAAAPWIGLLALLWWVLGDRNAGGEAARRVGWVVVLGAWGLLARAWAPPLTHPESRLALHFLDVGQGDAVAIRTPCGRWLLIDAGPRYDRYDAGAQRVVPFLLRHGTRGLSVVVASHAHADHLGGIGAVLDRFPAGLVIEPGAAATDPLYRAFLAAVDTTETPWKAAAAGEHFTIDGVRFSILHPDTAWSGWAEDLNEDSVVLLVEYGEFDALLMGDAGLPVESQLRGQVGEIDVLKVGHHGSKTASGAEWLGEVHPKLAVISVGRNRYGHPDPKVVSRLATHGQVWRTDRDGTVTVVTDGVHLEVNSRSKHSTLTDLRDRGAQLDERRPPRSAGDPPACTPEEWLP